jgi:diaminopropionate ammonia-lyase
LVLVLSASLVLVLRLGAGAEVPCVLRYPRSVLAFANHAVRRDTGYRGLFTDDEYREVHAYFNHPELAATPLKELASLAADLGVESVLAKDETRRFGLNAFKIAGVRYAFHRLGDAAAAQGVVCATAGNHGRAVARVAHDKCIPCTVFVPASRVPVPGRIREPGTGTLGRVEAMRADGATVVDVDGTYEDAVRQAADFGEKTGATIVSDTSWDGYEQIPHWIMAGYTHILEEVSSQWHHRPTLVIVQGGVGGLVCAAASWFAHRFGPDRPYFIAAEPENAACLMMSAKAGHPVTIDASLNTIMAGLRCAEPSPAAWPAVSAGVDAFVSVQDGEAIAAMRLMSAAGGDQRIDAGPSGACGLAALMTVARAPQLADVRSAAGMDRRTRALVIITEGP